MALSQAQIKAGWIDIQRNNNLLHPYKKAMQEITMIAIYSGRNMGIRTMDPIRFTILRSVLGTNKSQKLRLPGLMIRVFVPEPLYGIAFENALLPPAFIASSLEIQPIPISDTHAIAATKYIGRSLLATAMAIRSAIRK